MKLQLKEFFKTNFAVIPVIPFQYVIIKFSHDYENC